MSGVLLIDGPNLLIRAVCAADRVPLSVDGVPTAALTIFINLMSHHVREEAPDQVVVCWDGGKSAYRVGLYPAYKANRVSRPDDEADDRPFGQAKEFLTLAGIHHVERPGWEADDLIGCYWRSVPPSTRIVILSADKDMLQLLGPDCEQVRPSTRPPTDRWTAESLEADWGIAPRHLSKAMALTGDPGDNVPGLRGYGMRTAVKRLRAVGWDLEAFLSAHDLPGPRDQVRLSHRLVDLRDVPYATLGLTLDQPPEFTPTAPGGVLFGELMGYLDRWRLEGARQRLLAGTLWGTGYR